MPALPLALLLGCQSTPPAECAAAVDASIATVVRVSAAEGDTVAYGPSVAFGWTARGGGEVALHGMPADTDVFWRVTDMAGDEVCAGVTRTGPLPDDIPELEVTVGAEAAEPYLLVAFYQVTANRTPIVVVDRAGEVVWYTYGPPDKLVIDVQPALDGDGLLYDAFDLNRREDGVLARVTLDGEVTREVPLPDGHHMFAQLPDGTLAWQTLDVREAVDPRTGEPDAFFGDAIVETAPDGTSTTVFSTWDWVPVVETAHWATLNLYGDGVDWTHGNALKHDAATDRYLLSLGHAGAILDIQRGSFAPVATYGAGGVGVAEGGHVFDFQHDPSWLADGHLLMFSTDDAANVSGAVEYAVEGDALREVWRYGFDELEAPMLGQAIRLESGNTLVNFGGAGVMREVSPAGEVVWELVSRTSTARFAQARPWPGFTAR